jgi:hypothetical protein
MVQTCRYDLRLETIHILDRKFGYNNQGILKDSAGQVTYRRPKSYYSNFLLGLMGLCTYISLKVCY